MSILRLILCRFSNWKIMARFVLNAACWFFPDVAIRYGLGFNLTAIGVTGNLNVDVNTMPGWQLLGGIILASIPLLLLAYGLNALRCLFKLYCYNRQVRGC